MKIKKWFKKDNFIKIKSHQGTIIVENNSCKEGKIYSAKLFRPKNEYLNICFDGKTINGSGAVLTFINRKRFRILNVILGSKTSSIHHIGGLLMPVIIIKPYTKIEINEVSVQKSESREVIFNKYLGSKKHLLICPSYPSPDNMYACGFIHTRVKEYLKRGLDVEVAVINHYNESSSYDFEGVNVYKTNLSEMRDILMAKSYDSILVHFLDSEYAKYLTTSYLNDTPVFLWNHGADILFKDYKDFYTPYFSNHFKLPDSLITEYKKREKYINELSKKDNIYWIFVSEWEKNRAEYLLKLKFKNFQIIHNYINDELFSFVEKDVDNRKNIFILRRFDNFKKYAVDISILTILELSRRPIFKDLKFFICGEGNYFNELVEPVRKFDNVIINNNFLSHNQIYEYHKQCGIGLFPTRQDTQGVSALEAASSGLVVLTSDIPVINEFFDKGNNILSDPEDYIEFANKIEYFYNHPKEFLKVSKKLSNDVKKNCSMSKTIDKEIEFIQSNQLNVEKIISIPNKISKTPLLSITIPSYNASKFLRKCLLSILKSKYLGELEILVINDGSKDNTKEIGQYYEDLLSNKTRKIVKLIDKENGGHGSGINKGIELASGKYFRVIDSDDWIDTDEFDKYIERLINEDSDEILTDYCEARTFEEKLVYKETFKFMNEGSIYNVNDICSGTYGFRVWGPSLPTATYKTEILRKTNFKLPEHKFYVDMLYNAYSIINMQTIKKYPENIYRYYIGNIGQSVSKTGMMRNYKHHEDVIILLLELVSSDSRITSEKKKYIIDLLLRPMVGVQYYICLDLFHSRNKFMTFEKRLKKFKQYKVYPEFNTRRIKVYRLTLGFLIPFHPVIHKICDKFRKVIK